MGDHTPGTPTEVEFELVTRKKKGKKNSKSRPHFTDFNDAKIKNNNRIGRENSTNNIIYGEPYVESDSVSYMIGDMNDMNMIHTDAAMKNPPQYAKETETEEEKKVLSPNTIPSEQLLDEQFQEYINKRALSKFATTYELEKFEKKALLIFNHIHVDGYSPRLGTEKDVSELERTFKSYGFEVEVEHDLKRDEVMDRLREFTTRDFTDYGCVGVAVLTHGSRDGRIKARDMAYSELEIVKHLQVRDKPTLITKPRIVIIQACRGTKSIKAVPVGTEYRIQTDLEEEIEPYTLPVESDMLVLHSSYIGKVSHRHELDGSWFIQALCGKIKQLSATMDMEAILVEVKREVAIDKQHAVWNRRTYEYETNKQMPVSTSTLIRKLYLRKFGDAPQAAVSPLPAYEHPSGQSVHTAADNSSPNTPLLVQYGPCSCFLDHFSYIKDCLSHFLAENPTDTLGQSYLAIANTLEEGNMFNSAKEKTAKVICKHLKTYGRDYPYFKYLYFYKH